MDAIDRRIIMGKVLAGMANGARFIKGTVTIPSGATSGYYTINFGETFDEYLFYIEMDAASKTQLMNSGQTGDRQYALLYKYKTPEIGNPPDAEYKLSYRIRPSTSAFSVIGTNAGAIENMSSTSIDLYQRGIGNTYAFYPDYTYNYYIVEIK